MRRITKSAILPHPPDQLFGLVADIERYPQFLPWCVGAESRPVAGDEVEASLDIAKGPVKVRLTTRNRLTRCSEITMGLVSGPFRSLQGRWTFEPLGEHGCRASLSLEFEVAGGVVRRLLTPLFEEIASTMVDAFSRRAAAVLPAQSG